MLLLAKWQGSLIVDPLTIPELPRREELIEEHGIGRGEAACLVLVERYQAMGAFLSSDEDACTVGLTGRSASCYT